MNLKIQRLNDLLIDAVENSDIPALNQILWGRALLEEVYESLDIETRKVEIAERTPLMIAISKGNLEVVDILFKLGADVNAKNSLKGGSLTPLMIALMRMDITKGQELSSKAIVFRLLEAKPDIHAVNSAGNTALMTAIYMGNSSMYETLIELGSDVEHVGKLGRRPFLMCTKVEDFNFFASRGVDIHAVNSTGQTALLIQSCGQNKDTSVVRHLLKMGLDINHKDTQGLTALAYAASLGNLEMIEVLITDGADATTVTNKGESLLDMSDEWSTAAFITAHLENREVLKSVGEDLIEVNINKNRMRIL